MPVGLLRQLRPEEVKCPAGELVGDACVHCRIEESIIDGHLNPESLETFCLLDFPGGYQTCPSWRAEKHAIWAGERGVDLEKKPVDRNPAAAEVASQFSERMNAPFTEGPTVDLFGEGA